MNLYIMRHGETSWNKLGWIQGSSDIDLTEYGVELAHKTADGLCQDGVLFDRIYSSPYRRAADTANIIAEKCLRSGDQVIIDDRIREMCFGKYEGQCLKEIVGTDENIRNCFTVPSLYVPDETGETYQAVAKRVSDFLLKEILPLVLKYPEGNILAVCHGAVIRSFLTNIRHMDLDEYWTIHQPNCSINLVQVTKRGFTSIRDNILYYDAPKSGIL